MRLRARLAARSRDQAAAVEASGNEDGCETEADDPFSWASTEGPSAEEVGRAFLGDPEAESAGHGGWRGSAAQASSPLRSLLLKFKRPQDEDEHGAASMCAGGNGEDCACHGGAFFADHSCDSDFGGDGHAALAAALLSEARDTDQVSIFNGVAAGAADGRLDCSSKWAAWFEDDCCDFDLEVPEPSMLRYDGVAGNRTREPERNQQDPQRAKTDVDNGPLPQERFEKRPTGQRSHSVSSLTPYPSPEWAPLLPSASPSASHGFRSADSALRGVSDCLPSSVAPFGFSPPCSCGSPLGSVAMDLLPFPVSPSGSRPLSPKGLPQVPDIECPLGPDISGCAGRTRSLGGEGHLTSGVLRAEICTRASFAHGGSGWPKDPSISPECERACSCTGHDSMHASTCLPPSGHTGGSGSRAGNAFNDGPHTQMPFAAGGSSRPRGPCISPVSDCTCRSATPAPSVEPTFPRSLPGPCTFDRSAELDLLEDPRYQSVSPFGFCSPSPSGLPRHSAEQNLLPYPVPPLGFSPLPPKGLPLDFCFVCPLGPVASGCTGCTENHSEEGTLYPCELRDKLCAWASFADGGSSRPKGQSISSACERTCSCTGHDSSLASFCVPPSGHTGGNNSLVVNNMPPPSASDDGPHTQMSFAAGGPSRPKGPSISPVSDGTCRSAEPAPSLDLALPPSLPVVCALTCKNADSDPRDGVHSRSVSPFGFSPPSPSGLPFETASTGSLPPLVPPFGFSPSSPSGSPLCPAAEGLQCNPAPPLGFSAPFPKGLPRDPDFDCALGFVTPGSTARVKHLTGEGTSLACVLQAGLCDGVPSADGGSSRLKGPSISPTCEGACSNYEHVSPLASSCLFSSDCTGGSHSLADNNMPPLAAPNDGPHTQVYLAAGHLSRPRGPSIPPASDRICKSAAPATSVDPAIPLSLPGVGALDRSADSDLLEVPPCLLVSPFGFSPSFPSGSPPCSVAEGLLRNPVPPLGFSPPSPEGLVQDPDFEYPLGPVTPGSIRRVKHLSGEGTSTSSVLQAGLCDRVPFADGGSGRLKGPSISLKCERVCSNNEHDLSLASSRLSSSNCAGGSNSLVANNMPPPSASDDGPHTQMSFAAGGPSRPKGPSISPVSDGTCRSAEPAPSLDLALPPSLPVVCALTCKNADSDPRDGVHSRSVSPFGFSPPSPSGLPFETVSTGSLPPHVPPFGFSPSSPSGSPLQQADECDDGRFACCPGLLAELLSFGGEDASSHDKPLQSARKDQARASHLLRSAVCGLCFCLRGPFLTMMHNIDHDALSGTRIGEASNPGPAGAGLLQELLGGLDLKNLLRDLLQQIIRETLAGKSAATLVAALGPKQPKKRKPKLKKPPRPLGGAGAAAAPAVVQPAPQAPPSKGQGKGKRKVGAKGKGTGQEPPQGRPKGGATSDANRQGDDGGWVTVARKVKPQEAFTLRAKDWTAPILKAGELAAQLDALPDGKTLQGVVLAPTDDVFVSLKSVLRGCPKPHQVLLLRPSREPGSQRVPGQVGERLAFRNFEIANVNSENASGNAPKFQGTDGAPVKVRVTDSVVLYMRVSKLFCEPKLWTAFEKAAAKEALQWVASRHVQALDSFAWTREKARSGDSEQFFGLVRVAKENVGPLLSSSGQQGVFVSAPRNVPEAAAAACEVVWVDRAPQEKAVTYLERVTRMASSHGLALSNMRLGWRRPLAKDEVPARVWLVTDVPKSWDHRAVADLLDTAFADPVILSHRWAKKSLTYRFKAKVKSGGDKDIVPLVCEHLGANITLWASIAPPRKQQTLSKPVYTRSVPVIKAAATPNVATEAVAVPTANTQDETGKDQSQSKQAKQEVRKFPADLKHVECPRDGNCVLHAFSKALLHFREEERHPRILRAELVTHLLKHERYSREWDRLDPQGQPCPDFKTYCALIEKDSTYLGELEIAALSHITHLKTVVVPQGLDFAPAAYNTREKVVAVLWYTPGHVDLALPLDGGKVYPEFYSKTVQGPTGNLRAGGGATDSASSCATGFRRRLPSMPGSKVSGASGTGATSSCATPFRKRARSAVSTAPKAKATRSEASKVCAGPPAGKVPRMPKSSCDTGRRIDVTSSRVPDACRADLSDADSQNLSGCELEAPVQRRKLAPCSHRAPILRPADGVFRCRICPFTCASKSLAHFRLLNTQHYNRHHGGATLPGPLRRPKVGKVQGGATKRFWKCPLCPLGVSKEVRATITRHVFSQMREDHRQQHHPKVPKADWTRMITSKQTGPKDPKGFAAGCRQRSLQKVALKEVTQPRFPGMQTFLWPVPKHFPHKKDAKGAGTKNAARKIKRISLTHAWLCQKCGAATKDLPVVRRHSQGLCPPAARASIVTSHRLRQLATMRQWVLDHVEATEQQLYLHAIDGAVAAVQKRASPAASSLGS